MNLITKRKNKGRYHKIGKYRIRFVVDKRLDEYEHEDHPLFKEQTEAVIETLKTCSFEGLPEYLKKGFEEMQRELNAADRK